MMICKHSSNTYREYNIIDIATHGNTIIVNSLMQNFTKYYLHSFTPALRSLFSFIKQIGNNAKCRH